MQQYYVNFYSYDRDLAEGSPGHVFVGFLQFLNSDLVSNERYGFYPVGDISKLEAIEGKKGGAIKSDEGTMFKHQYENSVSFKNFSEAKNILKIWQSTSRKYKLWESDCITFAIEIAQSLELATPSRPPTVLTPGNFIDVVRFEHINYLKRMFGS